ncbi:MAG: hypothetical protein QM483_06035 [Desulfuromusa sp.]
MSEFINRSKIAALEQSNSELIDEISNLQTEIQILNSEIETLKEENPDDIERLSKKVTEYEQRETEFQERILSISREAKNNPQRYKVVQQLLSVLQVKDPIIVETAIEQYYKKNATPKVIIAFLLGTLVALVAWFIVDYLKNDEPYNAIIKQVINFFSNF